MFAFKVCGITGSTDHVDDASTSLIFCAHKGKLYGVWVGMCVTEVTIFKQQAEFFIQLCSLKKRYCIPLHWVMQTYEKWKKIKQDTNKILLATSFSLN